MVKHNLMKDKIFNGFNSIFMLIVIFLTLYPFLYSLAGSFNVGSDYMKGGVYIWPRKFTLDNYKIVFSDLSILTALKITVARTVLGTVASVLFTSVFAYGFSRKDLIGKKYYAAICLITMYFSGGLIPYYMVVKQLGMVNHFVVYIIPGLFSFFNVLILQSFFREIPESIVESAKMDGAGEYMIFFKLIAPLSKPVLATVALFNAVGNWNAFFDSMLFTTKPELQTIQLLLMKIIRSRDGATKLAEMGASVSQAANTTSVTIQLATMIVATVPIILVYPFLQRYFVSGLTIGSVKG